MTRYILLAVLISLFTFCKPTSDAKRSVPEYALVWFDEFNSNTIDTTNWNFNIGGHGWGNNEQEYYTDKNATIEDGNLVITAKEEQVGSNPYTSSRMTTKGKREFLYGKIEARIKIPTGQGVWPAFWMLGSNIDAVGWPNSGEIDIMEHINTSDVFFGTIHWGNNGHKSTGDSTVAEPEDFHIYSIEWDADSIKWYLDGKDYHRFAIKNNIDSTEEFHQPFFILLNVAIGGNWPGQDVDKTRLPARMLVDYVRCYQKK